MINKKTSQRLGITALSDAFLNLTCHISTEVEQ